MTVSPGYPANYPNVYSHTWQTQGWTIQEIPAPTEDVLTAFVGTQPFFYTNQGGTDSVQVKNTTGNLYLALVFNLNQMDARYLRFYAEATVPVVGVDTSFITIPIPAGTAILVDPAGQVINNGLNFTITGGPGDSDTTAVPAGQVQLLIAYS